jgi:RHS repeat-associated protein
MDAVPRPSPRRGSPPPIASPAADDPPRDPLALPAISLPKGGGAIRGIDEKLTVALATGAASVSVPLRTTPSRGGFGPDLALSYDSGGGNGPFGLGWRLGTSSITRKTSRGLPRYQDDAHSDVFVLSEVEDLVPSLVEEAGGRWVEEMGVDPAGRCAVFRYRPRVEAAFSRIERWKDIGSGEVHWRVVSRDNVTRLFGRDATSRIADPADPTRVFSWLLDLSFDDRGNAISYEYKAEDAAGDPAATYVVGRTITANRYVKRIRYGNTTPYRPSENPQLPTDWRFEVVLDYGEHDPARPTPAEAAPWSQRPDAFSTYRSCFEIRTQRLCRRFLMFHHFPEHLGDPDVLVAATQFDYSTDTATNPSLPALSLLTTATQFGYIRDPATGEYSSKQLPPLEFGYSPVTIDDVVQVADPNTLADLPTGGSGPMWRWADLDGEGMHGVLFEDDSAWYFKRNVSAYSPDGSAPRARFEPLRAVTLKPSGPGAGAAAQLVDLHGDGHLCTVDFSPPMPGYCKRDDHGGWLPFTPFTATAAIDWSNPNVRAVDLDGDGLADVILTEDDAFTWFPWLAEDGFGAPVRVATTRDENAGPAVVLADGDSSIFLADMSGDGLSDLVRVRNGEVSYWPNLGYGRFGAKVVMDAAPLFEAADTFSAHRVRLADIDGSGTADLVYVSGSGVRIWFNQSGNSFTNATALSQFPDVDDHATVEPMDLLGSGTTCLTWCSPLPAAEGRQLRYIDLMGGVKPHLLTAMTNNFGAETTLTYATSTRYYLADRSEGQPWATPLAFPVHVVSRREVLERVSGTRLVSTYRYRHGFFDGVEREFRGFGMVEQSDAEALPAASGTGTFTESPANGEFDLPPVRTRSWFHTGAFVGGDDIAKVLARDFFAGDPAAGPLGDTLFEGVTSTQEKREACRALRGKPLRTEVYADDGSTSPYSVTDHRYHVRLLQHPSGTSYGSLASLELEARSFQYERNPTDPRVGHELILDVDPFGTVTKSAHVGYRRRQSTAGSEQGTTHVVYTEHDVVNLTTADGAYRLGVPIESRTFELTGLGARFDTAPFDPGSLLTDALAALQIPYEDTPDPSAVQKRLIGCVRTCYRSDDLAVPLPLGRVDPLAIVDRSYTLAMTPTLAATIYATTIPDAATIATSKGGYVDMDADGSWWAPSARLFYSPDSNVPDVIFARQHFFLPQGHVDPFGSIATVGWADDLVIVSTTDPVGNTVTAATNYRVLQPWLMTDPNANRTGVRYDELGFVVAGALMGKAQPGGGDEGDHLDLGTAEAAPGDDPTSVLDYDLDAYRNWANNPARDELHPQPVSAHTRQRVRHKDPQTPWIESYAYPDGLGRLALTKHQAEPGEAPVVATDGTVAFAPTTTRWVGTGKVVYDNKAHPVKAYEPFFDSTPTYTAEPTLVQWGVTAITRYDPLGRAVRVDKPDGTFTSVTFDPWQQQASDENDNVLDSAWFAARSAGQLGASQQDAAAKAAAHANTPLISDLDSLGRVFHTIADGPNGQFETRFDLDVQGRVLATTDAFGRAVMTTDYGVAGATIHTSSVDAGNRWILPDSAGQPLRTFDSRNSLLGHTYDAARRPVAVVVTAAGASPVEAESVIYGEGQPDDVKNNLRGAAYQLRDSAGVATTLGRDFKGNTLNVTRELLTHIDKEVDWSSTPELTGEIFATSMTYDALNRVATTTTPDSSVTAPAFNERSLLAGMTLALPGASPTTYIDAVNYDAKGQRQSITYGNGAVTTYDYDAETFRLVHLVTSRPTGASPVQDLTYCYDPVGNVMQITDAAQSTIFFANQLVAPVADYTYDAIYRLISATGREHIGQTSNDPVGWDDSPRRAEPLPTDPQAMRNYTETYLYDRVGNLTSLAHAAANGSWTRAYTYDAAAPTPTNNQLTATQVGALTESYSYDPNGNMTSMPHLSVMTWDFKDHLASTARQVLNAGAPETTWYRYDTSGHRVRKATLSRTGTPTHERIYLDGYEIYREYSTTGDPTLERQTITLPDAGKHLALIDTTTVDASKAPAMPPPTIRYQFANHLGSASVEVDENAAVITYEEYYPYGATSFQAGRSAAEVSLKRYRFTDQERDEETSLAYHDARYYAPWLGRWTACDPIGAGQQSTYAYCSSNPVNYSDRRGLDEDPITGVSFVGPGDAGNTSRDGQYRGTQNEPNSCAGYSRMPSQPSPEQLSSSAKTPAPPTPFQLYVASAQEQSSLPAWNQGVPETYEERVTKPVRRATALAQKYPALAPSIEGSQREEFFITAAPFFIPEAGEARFLEGSTSSTLSRVADAPVTEGALANPAAGGLLADPPPRSFVRTPSVEFSGERTPNKLTENEQKAWDLSNELGVEYSLTNDKGLSSIPAPDRSTIEVGPHVTSSAHTHPMSGVALPSREDIMVFQDPAFLPDTKHRIVGAKWPHTNLELRSLEMEIVPDAKVGVITTQQARLIDLTNQGNIFWFGRLK